MELMREASGLILVDGWRDGWRDGGRRGQKKEHLTKGDRSRFD